jgi:carbohydrate kinase (thermoresistant glucokinase family)
MFIFFIGVSGCGKTTIGKRIADKLVVPYYEGDEFHSLINIEKMSQGIPLTDEDREDWLERLAQLIQEKLDLGESGVLSCFALNRRIAIYYGLTLIKSFLFILRGAMRWSSRVYEKEQTIICQPTCWQVSLMP